MNEKNAPWFPPAYEPADISAIKGLAAGTATPDQQRRALKWIIENACATYELSYRPNSEGDTAFAEGRRFVGLQIVKALHIPMELILDQKR